MGIKGKRKRDRLREEKLLQEELREAAEAQLEENQEGFMNGEEGDDDDDGYDEEEAPMKIKKSDLYMMRDLEYMDNMREEHEKRRTSHLGGSSASGASGSGGKRKKNKHEAVADHLASLNKKELDAELHLQSHFMDESALDAITGLVSAKLRKSLVGGTTGEEGLNELEGATAKQNVSTGARFSHPLIGVNSFLVDSLQSAGFDRMTRIQERVIPNALDGFDILGQARTGSGKTLAFCVPILNAMLNDVSRKSSALGDASPSAASKTIKHTYAVILAPTKELCVQIHTVLQTQCQKLARTVATFTVQLITGGTKVQEERRILQSGVNLVVGTPGRIHDHVKNCRGWNCGNIKFFVLDEADRMLADGFQKDLDAILAHMPTSRQTFLFSATNSKSVKDLARLSLSRSPIFISTSGNAPVMVESNAGQHGGRLSANGSSLSTKSELPPYRVFTDMGSDSDESDDDRDDDDHNDEDENGSDDEGKVEKDDDDDAGAIPSTLRQFCHIVPLDERLIALYVFMKRVAKKSKAMVFCSTVASTTFHFQMMGSIGFHDDVIMLHGHMKHRQRLAAFKCFLEWETGVLFCTDVAARGLDIPNVEWILQYDPPLDPTEYIHRIGRTARAGNVGNALLFLAPQEAAFVPYLSRFGIQLEKYPMPSKLPDIQMKLEHVLQLDPIVAKSAVIAFRASVGAYQSHILSETFSVHRLDLNRLATSFALTSAPHVSLPKNSSEEKKKEYVKGKLKSLNKRSKDALQHYEANKTRKQWESDGTFVGISKPHM